MRRSADYMAIAASRSAQIACRNGHGSGATVLKSSSSRRLPSCISRAPTMLRLTRERRGVLSDAFRELANLSAGALVLGQFVGQRPLSVVLVLVGITVWIGLIGAAVLLAKGRP